MTYIVKKENGKLYWVCNDGMWREMAGFGTFSSCITEYKRAIYPIKRAQRIQAICDYHKQNAVVRAVTIPPGFTVDINGNVWNEDQTKKTNVMDYVVTSK